MKEKARKWQDVQDSATEKERLRVVQYALTGKDRRHDHRWAEDRQRPGRALVVQNLGQYGSQHT